MRITFAWALLVLAGCCGGAIAFGAPEEDAATYVLPPFEVTEVPEGLPWKYVRTDGLEMITLWPRDKSKQMLLDLLRGQMFFPKASQAERTSPMAVILFDATITKSPKAGLTVQRRSKGSARLSATGSWRGYDGGIRTYDGDSVIAAYRYDGLFPSILISHGLSEVAFGEGRPEPRAWLRQGLFGGTGLYAEVGVYSARDEVRVASLLWIDEAETAKLKHNPAAVPDLIPLGRFFNDPPPDAKPDPHAYALWESQARLFVHWALIAKKKPAVAAADFWGFANESRLGPVTEERFRQLFKRDYATTLQELRAYLPTAVKSGVDRAMPGLHAAGEKVRFEFRAATEAEVARIKGDFERLEAKRLKTAAPELAARYEAAARRTLGRALHFMPVDNRIYAGLGLLEFDTGHPVEARRQLERAHASGDLGTRGLLALTQLRLEEIQAGLPAGGQLSAKVLEQVLAPLFAARERKPAVVETYRLLADVWAQSAVTPTRDQLAVLLEGVGFFPWDDGLRERTVALHQQYGYSDALTQP